MHAQKVHDLHDMVTRDLARLKEKYEEYESYDSLISEQIVFQQTNLYKTGEHFEEFIKQVTTLRSS